MFNNTGKAISYCAATDKANSKTAIITPYGTAAAPFHMVVLSQNIGRFHPFTVFCPVHEKTRTLLNPHPIELKDIHYTDDCQVSFWPPHWTLAWGGASQAISIALSWPLLQAENFYHRQSFSQIPIPTFRSTNIFLQFDAFVAYWSSRFKPCKHTLPHPPLSWRSDACDFVFANLLSQPCPTLSCFSIVCPFDIFAIKAGRDWQEEESVGVP